MKLKKDIYARIDEQGRLVLPPDIAARYGLKPGGKVPITAHDRRFTIRQPVQHLTKIYIEPTNACNLSCRTCVRRCWDEQPGMMEQGTVDRIIGGLEKFPAVRQAVFGGFGEPLLHPEIDSMVARVKQHVAAVELITNGMLLTGDMTSGLCSAGLDVLWVSLDGATPDKCEDIRQGSQLSGIVQNIERAREILLPAKRHIGIVFVAMRSNIEELPAVFRLGRTLGADRFLVTNVVPYTAEMCGEQLYSDVQHARDISQPSVMAPHVHLPKIDMSDSAAGPLQRIIRGRRITSVALDEPVSHSNYCPFVERGSVAICWDGYVSPCLPLMHSYTTFLNDNRRFVRRCTFGRLQDSSLYDIWHSGEYTTFRERVQAFDFSPCVQCGGCRLSRENEDDCLGSGFPACGGCLWAQGIIQCP